MTTLTEPHQPVNETIEAAFGDLRVIEQTEVPGVAIRVVQAASRACDGAGNLGEEYPSVTAEVFLNTDQVESLIWMLQRSLVGVLTRESGN